MNADNLLHRPSIAKTVIAKYIKAFGPGFYCNEVRRMVSRNG